MTLWGRLLRDVPRSVFLPETLWVRGEDGFMVPIHRAQAPEHWRELCDADDAVVTQVDDGAEERGFFPTSSSSAPFIMAAMLDALDVEPGMRVLEIGTGTGYNAAVLSEGVGAENVVTIEVDPAVADHARAALSRCGYPVMVITGDGTLGHPDRAPYDRVIATAAVTDIPCAWIAQTRPGGKVVVPWTSTFPASALLELTVDDDRAYGRFTEDVGFMVMRGQRTVPSVPWDSSYETSTTRLYPNGPFDGEGADSEAAFALGAALPGCRNGCTIDEEGVPTLRLAHSDSGSWASCTRGEGEHEVRQHGPRRLWDEFEQAYRWWIDAGRPDRTRFGMTVTPDGQHLWLDSPDHPVA